MLHGMVAVICYLLNGEISSRVGDESDGYGSNMPNLETG